MEENGALYGSVKPYIDPNIQPNNDISPHQNYNIISALILFIRKPNQRKNPS